LYPDLVTGLPGGVEPELIPSKGLEEDGKALEEGGKTTEGRKKDFFRLPDREKSGSRLATVRRAKAGNNAERNVIVGLTERTALEKVRFNEPSYRGP